MLQGLLLTAVVVGMGLLLRSCVRDGINERPSNNTNQVTFTMKVPKSAGTQTRAMSTVNENKVTGVDILIFNPNGGTLVDRASVQSASFVNNADGTYSFTVTLVQGNFDLAILANANDIVSAKYQDIYGTNKADAMQALKETIPSGGKWPTDGSKAFPMWADIGNVTIEDNSSLPNLISLTRMVSRVDVIVEASSFNMNSVYVYNYNTEGSLAPTADDWNAVDRRALSPNVPISSTINKGPIAYTGLVTDDKTLAGTIYMFEAENHTNATHTTAKPLLNRTCLVVGGFYDAENDGFSDDTTEYFYRVDFSIGNGMDQSFIDVLRNHQYIFTVTAVLGEGFDTPEEAFNSGPMNVNFEILYWNQTGMGNIVFDGTNTLAVNKDDFTIFNNANTDNDPSYMFEVYTDVTAGWTIEKIVDANDNAVTWLSATEPQSGPAGVETPVYLKYEANPSATQERDAYIWIKATRLRFPIHVKQLTVPPLGLDILDENGQPVSELIFESSLGSTPTPQQFTVKWDPKTQNVAVTTATLGSDGDFPYASAAGINPGNMSDPSGQKTFTVTLPQVTESDIRQYPLMDKVTRIDFTVTNGASYISKSIILRQRNYDIVSTNQDYAFTHVDADLINNTNTNRQRDSWLLDGKARTISMRSNTQWRVTDIQEHVYTYSGLITDPTVTMIGAGSNLHIGLEGGYNPTGEGVVLVPINDSTKWGDMVITFEDPTGKVQGTRKDTIIFALPEVGFWGVGFSAAAYNPAFPRTGGSTINTAYKMLTSENNFGTTMRVNDANGAYQSGSRVYARGFNFGGLSASAHTITASEMAGYTDVSKTDILVFTYDQYLNESTTGPSLRTYLENGGVLMLFHEYPNVTLLRSILNNTSITRYAGGGAGTTYRIYEVADDPVIYGAFGDMAGKYWGEDSSTTNGITYDAASTKDLIIYNTANSMACTVCFRYKDYPFIYNGDGGFFSAYTTDTGGGAGAYPFRLDNTTGAPTPQTSFANGGAYNSHFFANMITWAITQAKNVDGK
jgi:hypothetical protein